MSTHSAGAARRMPGQFLKAARRLSWRAKYATTPDGMLVRRKWHVGWGNLTHPRLRAERRAWADDTRYVRCVGALLLGRRVGNPPDSRALDVNIAKFAEEYPEHSALDRLQAEIDDAARFSMNYPSDPPYEGPGYTEPPVNWEGWHKPHSEYEKDHYWDQMTHDWPDVPLAARSTDVPEYDDYLALPEMEAGQ